MKKNSKESIVSAAVSLFNTKGYSGTSIRDIANKANVNVANISYYFQNKKGLLEYCFTSFFERYIEEIESGFIELNSSPTLCLKKIVQNIMSYQCRNIQLTRFILREMSIDSQIVREIMSTYYAKERFYLTKVLEQGIKLNEFKPQSINYSIIQLKGLLMMPFLNTHYVSEVLHVYLHEPYFERKYLQEIHKWIEDIVCISKLEKDYLVF